MTRTLHWLLTAFAALLMAVSTLGHLSAQGTITPGRLLTQFLAGTGSTLVRPTGMLFTPVITDVTGTADTNFNCVALGTLSANTITRNGDQVVVEFETLNAAGASTRTFNVNLGGTCAADGTGFTGGVTFYSSTNAVAAAQLAHVARLLRTSAGNFKGSGGYLQTNGSATQGSTFTTGTATDTGALALGLAFKDGASAQNTLKNAVVLFRPAP